MRKLLITALVMFSCAGYAQEAPKKDTLCLPLPQMMEMITGVGFIPVFKSSGEKTSTVVLIQADKKAMAVIVFDSTAKDPKESISCLATMQENLQMNEKVFEEVMRKLVGVRA